MAGTGSVSATADGCYEAGRAAALSGVPVSTVYWWARKGVVVPTVSPVKEMLWSYSDLMALRIVSWLRHSKSHEGGASRPSSPMPKVLRALALLERLDLNPWHEAGSRSPLRVDRAGEIFIVRDGEALTLDDQPTLLPADVLDLTGPFSEAGQIGPDLLRPRPHLRIVPAKVAGEPHVAHSRLTTQTLAALAARGYPSRQIADMYGESEDVVDEAIDLEKQLAAA